jgi:dienelactone hydrolase
MKSIVSTVFTILPSITVGFSIPTPPGKYNVTMSSGVLVDHSRDDRALMVSVFQPAGCKFVVDVPYMPNATAAYQGAYIEKLFKLDFDFSPLLLQARLPVCLVSKLSKYQINDCSPVEDDLPVILVSSGLSSPRGHFHILASALASEGFTVFTANHPGETNIITYPDGHSVTFVGPDPVSLDIIAPYIQPRVLDTRFILDQLSNATAMGELFPQRGPRSFPTNRIAMVGHSLGGVTAVHAAAQDSRIRAVVDWDQQLFGPALPSNFTTPVMFFNRPNSTEPNWLDAWPQIQGPMFWAEVANTTHQTFFDPPMLLKVAGEDLASFADFAGTIDAEHMLRMQVAYALEWVKGAFAGKIGGSILEGKEQAKFPEITVIERRGF